MRQLLLSRLHNFSGKYFVNDVFVSRKLTQKSEREEESRIPAIIGLNL